MLKIDASQIACYARPIDSGKDVLNQNDNSHD